MGCPTVFASRMSAAEIECRSVMMLTRSECRKNDEDRSGGWRVEDLRRGEKCIKAKVSMKVVMARNANASDLNTRESICQFGFPLARFALAKKVLCACAALLCCGLCVSVRIVTISTSSAREISSPACLSVPFTFTACRNRSLGQQPVKQTETPFCSLSLLWQFYALCWRETKKSESPSLQPSKFPDLKTLQLALPSQRAG